MVRAMKRAAQRVAGGVQRNAVKLAVGAAVVGASATSAFATGAVDTDVQGALDNLAADWSAIKTPAIAILGLMIAVGLLKKGYRKLT